MRRSNSARPKTTLSESGRNSAIRSVLQRFRVALEGREQLRLGLHHVDRVDRMFARKLVEFVERHRRRFFVIAISAAARRCEVTALSPSATCETG